MREAVLSVLLMEHSFDLLWQATGSYMNLFGITLILKKAKLCHVCRNLNQVLIIREYFTEQFFEVHAHLFNKAFSHFAQSNTLPGNIYILNSLKCAHMHFGPLHG